MLILRVASAWVENQEAKYALTSSLPSMKAGPREFLFPSEHGYFGMKFGAAVSLEKIGQLVNLLKNFSAYSEATDVLANQEVKKDMNSKVTDTSDVGNKYIQQGSSTFSGSRRLASNFVWPD